jgi:hypothetical protein
MFRRLWNNYQRSGDRYNTVVHVPKCTVAVSLLKRKQKYVRIADEKEKPIRKMDIIDHVTSVFRPETPTGMTRVVENQPVGTWTLIVYKKKRIYVSTVRQRTKEKKKKNVTLGLSSVTHSRLYRVLLVEH